MVLLHIRFNRILQVNECVSWINARQQGIMRVILQNGCIRTEYPQLRQSRSVAVSLSTKALVTISVREASPPECFCRLTFGVNGTKVEERALVTMSQLRSCEVVASKNITLKVLDSARPTPGKDEDAAKALHRQHCLELLGRARPDTRGLSPRAPAEAVMIEFRELPHIEFLVRNAIAMLPHWHHTVVCGPRNAAMVRNFQLHGIRICVVPDVSSVHDYNEMLLRTDFWEDTLVQDKVLIHQEDSVIFRADVDKYLQYDYIGALWDTARQSETGGMCVGNGGFSLRTRLACARCCRLYASDTSGVRGALSARARSLAPGRPPAVPEDVVIPHIMQSLGIGRVAPAPAARLFAQETCESPTLPCGGHCWWMSSPGSRWDPRQVLRRTRGAVALATPFDFLVGGGEKYLCDLMVWFSRAGCRRITLYTHTPAAAATKTLRVFAPEIESVVRFESWNHLYEDSSWYDVLIEMTNSGWGRRLQTKRIASKQWLHCQFPYDMKDPPQTTLAESSLRHFDGVIANSAYTARHLRSLYSSLDVAPAVRVVHPVCDVPGKCLGGAERPAPAGRSIYMMCGRMFWPVEGYTKGFEKVIEVFRSARCSSELRIMGRVSCWEFFEHLQSLAAGEDRISLVPDPSNEAVRKSMEQSTHFVSATGFGASASTPECFEHFGIAVVQAVMCGCVPVCIRGGTPAEIFGASFGDEDTLRACFENAPSSKHMQQHIAAASQFTRQKHKASLDELHLL